MVLLTQDSASDGTNISIAKYTYNTSDQPVKIANYYNGSSTPGDWDTLLYASGKLSKLQRYNSGSSTPEQVQTYFYSGSVLDSITETGTNDSGAYALSHIYTYASGTLTRYHKVFRSGKNDAPNEPADFSSIVFTNGNIDSLMLADAQSNSYGMVKADYDLTAERPFKSWTNDPEEILDMFCTNNETKIYLSASPTTPFFTVSYTYDNGRVATETEVESTNTYIHHYTWTEFTK